MPEKIEFDAEVTVGGGGNYRCIALPPDTRETLPLRSPVHVVITPIPQPAYPGQLWGLMNRDTGEWYQSTADGSAYAFFSSERDASDWLKTRRLDPSADVYRVAAVPQGAAP